MKNESATKNDILELKKAIESKIDETNLRLEAWEWRTIQLEDRVSNFEEKTSQNFDKVLGAVDGIARRFTDAEIDKASFNSAINRHEDKLDDHENRITDLEGGKPQIR